MKNKTSDHRKMAIQGFDSVGNSHYFHALLEFQVDGLRSALREMRRDGQNVSLFAAFLKVVGTALHDQPLFNSMADYSKTTRFENVDIAVPIEIVNRGKIENRQYVVRDVANKSVQEITAELESSKNDTEGKNGFIESGLTEWILARLPRWVVTAIFKSGIRNHEFVQKISGTTFVTSVSMFSNVPGFVVPFAGGPKATSFAFGSIYRKPVVIGDEIQIREVVAVTASFNHDVVDGAPAARFIGRLRRLVEKDFKEFL